MFLNETDFVTSRLFCPKETTHFIGPKLVIARDYSLCREIFAVVATMVQWQLYCSLYCVHSWQSSLPRDPRMFYGFCNNACAVSTVFQIERCLLWNQKIAWYCPVCSGVCHVTEYRGDWIENYLILQLNEMYGSRLRILRTRIQRNLTLSMCDKKIKKLAY